jgi:hypothetical protein
MQKLLSTLGKIKDGQVIALVGSIKLSRLLGMPHTYHLWTVHTKFPANTSYYIFIFRYKEGW